MWLSLGQGANAGNDDDGGCKQAEGGRKFCTCGELPVGITGYISD